MSTGKVFYHSHVLTGHKNAEMLFRYTDLNTASDLETEIKSIQREKMRNIRI